MHPARALIGLASAGLVTLAFPVTATPALATVSVTAGTPVQVVVDSPAAVVTLPVQTSSLAQGRHGASLWLAYPGDLLPELIGSGTGTGPQVSVRATLDTTRLVTWGLTPATVMDDGDGTVTPVVLDVRRRTVAMLNEIETRSGHRVALGARVTHYSPAASGYVSSNLSPVVYQEYTANGWVTRARSISTADGLAGVILRTTPGTHLYRVVRPIGATVWSGVSSTRRIVVPR